MKALIFAAGRGERMAELTRNRPKPLLEAGGKPLIHYTVERLKTAGVNDLLVNIAYLGQQIRDSLGDGTDFGVRIAYSEEPYPLETGGAIQHALPLLGDSPFLVVNADVWTDYPLQRLLQYHWGKRELGRLVMVPNPEHLPGGDFSLDEAGLLRTAETGDGQRFTYSGVALLRPELVADYPRRREVFPLGEVFRDAIAAGRLSGEVYQGEWRDIGTPERLRELDRDLSR